jgi:hypothetical protein
MKLGNFQVFKKFAIVTIIARECKTMLALP